LKSLLTKAPVLVYPRFGLGQSFLLETDASIVGLGAILSQQQEDGKYHPIAYASRSLIPSERNYPISELETLAIVWAVKYFRTYLLGYPCTVLTDHASCLSLLNTPNPSAKLARWAMAIQEMDLEIKHRSGRSNAGADALSRCPATVNAVTADSNAPADGIPESDTTDDDDHSDVSPLTLSEATQQRLRELSTLQKSCQQLSAMFLYLADGTLPEDDKVARKTVLESRHFDLLDGVLHHENPHSPGKWCVAVTTRLRADLLEDAHSGLLAGHLAEKRVYDRLRRSYWWQGMRRDVRKHCRACLTCATRRGVGRASHPPLHPIPVGGPFHCVGVDILNLPLTYDGNQ
jgi:phospholipid-translocating ATPase